MKRLSVEQETLVADYVNKKYVSIVTPISVVNDVLVAVDKLIGTVLIKCPKCDGCGQVANTEDQEPWTTWQNLPEGSNVAFRMGFVKPIKCPACDGTGSAARG